VGCWEMCTSCYLLFSVLSCNVLHCTEKCMEFFSLPALSVGSLAASDGLSSFLHRHNTEGDWGSCMAGTHTPAVPVRFVPDISKMQVHCFVLDWDVAHASRSQ